jgi:hypothetical protein
MFFFLLFLLFLNVFFFIGIFRHTLIKKFFSSITSRNHLRWMNMVSLSFSIPLPSLLLLIYLLCKKYFNFLLGNLTIGGEERDEYDDSTPFSTEFCMFNYNSEDVHANVSLHVITR